MGAGVIVTAQSCAAISAVALTTLSLAMSAQMLQHLLGPPMPQLPPMSDSTTAPTLPTVAAPMSGNHIRVSEVAPWAFLLWQLPWPSGFLPPGVCACIFGGRRQHCLVHMWVHWNILLKWPNSLPDPNLSY